MENKSYPTKATIFNRVFPGCHWAVKLWSVRTCIEKENKQTKTSSVLSIFFNQYFFLFSQLNILPHFTIATIFTTQEIKLDMAI